MDKLTLENTRDLPMTTNTLAFLQAAYAIFEQLGNIGGDNIIVSGCTVTGSSAAPGYMFLKGQLMPFKGGTITTNVKITKTVVDVSVDAGVRQQTSYLAEFGTSANPDDNVPWADILKIDTNKAIMTQIADIVSDIAQLDTDITSNASDIQINADAIAALTAALANKADDKLVYAARIYETGTVDGSTNYEEFVNKDGFVSSIDHTSGDEFQLNLKNSDSNWMNNLEVQATGMLPGTSSKNRNPTAFFRDAAYISLYLVDSSGNSGGDGAFWIRIYKWN